MHHIFFPPRPQVVALEQDANRLSAHPWDQLALDRLLRNQPHRPTGLSLRRITTDHRDDPLLFRRMKNWRRARTLLLVQGAVQAPSPYRCAMTRTVFAVRAFSAAAVAGGSTIGQMQ